MKFATFARKSTQFTNASEASTEHCLFEFELSNQKLQFTDINFGHFQIVKMKYSKNWRYKQSVIFNVTIQLETSSLFIVSSNPWLLTDHLCFMVEFARLFPLKTIVFSFHSMVDQISYQESCKGSKRVSISNQFDKTTYVEPSRER